MRGSEAFPPLDTYLSPSTPQEFASRFPGGLQGHFSKVSNASRVPDFDFDVRVPTRWTTSGDHELWESVVRIQYRANESEIPMEDAETRHLTPRGTFTFHLDFWGLRRVYRMFDIGKPIRVASEEV